jgi:hypothetical protein
MVCIVIDLYGQDNPPDFDKILEYLLPVADEEADLDALSETLFELYDHPIPLNSAGRSELLTIPLLSDYDVECILNYRTRYGDFLSPYELYLIQGLDSSKVDLLVPFIKIAGTSIRRDTISMMGNILKTSRKSIMLRYGRVLNRPRGYIDRGNILSTTGKQYFSGSPNYLYGRFEIHESDDFDIGITFEKDAGEPFFFDPSFQFYGFDHYAGYFRILNRGILKEIILGDFQMHFGEGLIYGRGFLNKGSETVGSVRNRYSGTFPYQGASESGFFRGLSLTFDINNFSFTGFGSRKLQDAAISLDSANSVSGDYFATGITETGYHRTPSEINKKQRLAEYAGGFNTNLSLLSGNLNVGVSFILNYWKYPIYKRIRNYNQYDFSGSINHVGGVYYRLSRGKLNIFGEAAMSTRNKIGFVQGLIANILPDFETTLHVRYYSPGFYTKYGKTFSEYSNSNNEMGIYWGIKIRPKPHLELRAYFDIFRSEWLRYNLTTPSTGNEYLILLRFDPKSSLSLDLTYKVESKHRNNSGMKAPLYETFQGIKRNSQLKISFQAGKSLTFQTRVLGNSYGFNEITTYGYSISQDVLLTKSSFQIKASLAYFNSDEYVNRHYLYEHDVLYSYNMATYNGHGLRAYVLFKYSPIRILDFWIKTSVFYYFDTENIGNGINMIPGNKKAEIKCQVRIKF